MYQQIILDHYRHPRRYGLRLPFSAERRSVNPLCGDEVTIRVRLESGTVSDLSYEVNGCAISKASASALAELTTGASVTDSRSLAEEFISMVSSRGDNPGDEELLGDAVAFGGVGQYPARIRCALMSWSAYLDALADTGA